jgi:hypothetical protein
VNDTPKPKSTVSEGKGLSCKKSKASVSKLLTCCFANDCGAQLQEEKSK